MDHVRRLFEHLWWADRLVLEGMIGATDPPAESIELLAHVLGAELVWLDRLEGVEQSVAVWPECDLEGCHGLADISRRRWERLLAELGPDDLARPVAYRNSADNRYVSSVGEILLHVALHGAYHRGQISRSLRDAGLQPAPTDFIAFARGAPAATRGDASS